MISALQQELKESALEIKMIYVRRVYIASRATDPSEDCGIACGMNREILLPYEWVHMMCALFEAQYCLGDDDSAVQRYPLIRYWTVLRLEQGQSASVRCLV